MKNISLCIIILLLNTYMSNVYSQSNYILKAWAIEEEIFGGAPPPQFEKPTVRKSIRFFMETLSNTKVKIIAVCIGKTPFTVLEKCQKKNFPDRDYKPADFNAKNNFIQVLVTDTLKTNSIKIPTDLIKQNQAVIIYLLKTNKKHFYPIKTIIKEHINLP